MSAFTSNLNLELPGGGSLGIGGSDEVADIDKLNQNFQKIDDWSEEIERVSDPNTHTKHFKGPATGIGSVTDPTLGDTYQETDGKKILWKYDGANWVTNEGGLYLIRPSSVDGTGVTIEPNGTVTFTSCSTLSLNGIFTERFREYIVSTIVTGRSGAAGTDYRLRALGVDDVTNNYVWRRSGTAGAGYSELTATMDKFQPDFNAYPDISKSFKITDPARSTFTKMTNDGGGIETDGASMTTLIGFAGIHRVVSAFDGITAYMTTGNMTGSIRVFGRV